MFKNLAVDRLIAEVDETIERGGNSLIVHEHNSRIVCEAMRKLKLAGIMSRVNGGGKNRTLHFWQTKPEAEPTKRTTQFATA